MRLLFFNGGNEAVRLCFMTQSAASYGEAVLHVFLMLDEQSSQAQMRFIKTPDDEAAPFHSAMKHFPLRFKYEALRFRGV